jgi:trk system potassium uptake protein TrkA
MKFIIMGCGRVGAALANMLVTEGHEVTVIDHNPQSFQRLGRDFSGTKLMGNGLDEDVLRKAGITRADSFIAVTNGDNRNIMAAQIAKHTFHVPRVICRIYDPIRQQVYQELGLESICPTTIGATLIHEAVLHPERSTISVALSIAEGRSVPTQPQPYDDVARGPAGGADALRRATNAGQASGQTAGQTGQASGQAPHDPRRQTGTGRR